VGFTSAQIPGIGMATGLGISYILIILLQDHGYVCFITGALFGSARGMEISQNNCVPATKSIILQ
jgi:hypothetical protein